MIKYLYANGDSWTFGNGIDEDPAVKHLKETDNLELTLDVRDKFTWPAILADKLGCDYINEAKGGGSNARILRKTTDFIQSIPENRYHELLIVLGWTTLERNEIYIDEPGFKSYFKFNNSQIFSTQFPQLDPRLNSRYSKEIDKYQRDYITHIQNVKMDTSHYFLQLNLMKGLLENKGIKYFFFHSIPWHINDEKQMKVFRHKLKKFASSKFYGAEESYDSMAKFIREGNYMVSSCDHPMTDGHKNWADFLYNKIIDIYGNKT